MPRRAFTLVELLVTIAIVGLVSSVAVVASGNSREKARIAAGQSFSAQLDRVAGNGEGGKWNLNEGTGTNAVDSIGGGHNGTVVNGATWTTDTPSGTGYALSLNGSNAYLQVPDFSGLKYTGGDMTLAIWAKVDSAESGGYFFSKPWSGNGDYNYTLGYGAGGVYITIQGWSSGVSNVVKPGRWSFVVMTVDSLKNVRIYVDGAMRFSAVHNVSSFATALDTNVPLAIGTFYPYGTGGWNYPDFSLQAAIDEPRVFNTAMTAEAVQKLYTEGLRRHSPGIAIR